jgi:hypothetical protein
MPIVLPIPDEIHLTLDRDVALRDAHNAILAVMRIDEIYEWAYTDACALIAIGTDSLPWRSSAN